MIITSLLTLALAFGNSSSNISISKRNVYQDDLLLNDNKVLCYAFNKTIAPSDNITHFLADMRLDLNVDSNYNEYLQVSYDVNFSDGYCYFSQESWLQNNYNVNAYSISYLYDLDTADIVVSWFSTNNILGTGETTGYGFGGDSDVLNFTWDSSHRYSLSSYVYLYLIQNFDPDVESDNQSSYDNGYSNGYVDGYDNGSADGYNNGYNTGKTDGYNQGYNTAISSHDFSFTNLFASISDTPILMIRRMFSFGIFGVSAISILLSLFTCLIFIKVIKKMW